MITCIQYVVPGTVITPFYEGVTLRVFKWNGKVYYASNRRLDARESKWGDSKNFYTMYQEAKGPSEDELFDKDCPYSHTMYVFTIVHPDILNATRQHVIDPYIVLIKRKMINIKRPKSQIKPGIWNDVRTDVPLRVVSGGGVYKVFTILENHENFGIRISLYDNDITLLYKWSEKTEVPISLMVVQSRNQDNQDLPGSRNYVFESLPQIVARLIKSQISASDAY